MPSFFKALMYPFEQRGWLKELLITIALAAIPIIGYFFVKGWEYAISTRVRHDAPRLFPGWRHPGELFKYGVLIGLAVILYNIPVYIAVGYTIWLWIGPLVKALLGVIDLNIPVAELYKSALGLRVGMIFVSLTIWFIMNSLYWSGYLRFIETRRYAMFFDLATNAIITFMTITDDLIMSVYLFLAQLIAGMIESGLSALLVATGIGTLLIPFLVPAVNFTFMSMFHAYLFGQLAEGTFGKDELSHAPRRRRQPMSRSELRRLRRDSWLRSSVRDDYPHQDSY